MIKFKDGADPIAVSASLTQASTQIAFIHATLQRAVCSYQCYNLTESKLAAMLEASVYITQKTLQVLEGANPFILSNILSKSISAIYGVLFQLEESKRMDTCRNDLLDVLNGLLLIITDVRATVANISSLANGHEMEFVA